MGQRSGGRADGRGWTKDYAQVDEGDVAVVCTRVRRGAGLGCGV